MGNIDERVTLYVDMEISWEQWSLTEWFSKEETRRRLSLECGTMQVSQSLELIPRVALRRGLCIEKLPNVGRGPSSLALGTGGHTEQRVN